jgi:hypothetical protein
MKDVCMSVYVLHACACMLCYTACIGPDQHWCRPIVATRPPPLGRRPPGPTQGTPRQRPDQFIPSSVTDCHARFCAPVRAARVGGGQSTPPAKPMGLLRAIGARRARPEPHPSLRVAETIWVGDAALSSRVQPLQHRGS